MTLINLLCPHCGGNFELDPDRPLQSFWVCPYCGNRSLMQKHDDTVRLRGIIPGRAQSADPLPVAIVQEQPYTDEHEAAPARPLSEMIAEASAPISESAAGADSAPTEMTPEEEPAANLTEKDAAVLSPEPPSDDVPETSAEVSNQEIEIAAPEPVSEYERLCQLAEAAAASRDLPLFNVYSRQALDLMPTGPRIYALRAELAEEADSFARATWASLGWSLLTPRRKTALIAQQLYNFNTALKYSRKSQQPEIISHLAWQIIRQAIDHFTEQGQLRCQKRLIGKTFKGRFSRCDIQSTYYLLDALRLINRQTCPLAYEELTGALRVEISKAPQRIARRLRLL